MILDAFDRDANADREKEEREHDDHVPAKLSKDAAFARRGVADGKRTHPRHAFAVGDARDRAVDLAAVELLERPEKRSHVAVDDGAGRADDRSENNVEVAAHLVARPELDRREPDRLAVRQPAGGRRGGRGEPEGDERDHTSDERANPHEPGAESAWARRRRRP